MPLFRRKRDNDEAAVTIFFVTDIHGSDVCFRKFLNAYAIYDVDILILGGDMTGKLPVPIVDEGDSKLTVLAPEGTYRVNRSELEEVRHGLHRSGFYPFVATPDELDRYRQSPLLLEAKLDELRKERVALWGRWAEEKLSGTEAEILVAPGNDDPFSIDDVLREAPRFRLVEGERVHLSPEDEFEMISTGYSNETPWNTHREMDETSLSEHLRRLANQVERPERAVFNIHVPPHRSNLDNGPMLDSETLKVKSGPGQDMTVPVGSRACREVLENYQPMLSLHGHIHESRGIARIGRTLAINPGSDYGDGILRGAIVRLDEGRGVVSHQLTSG
jgi:Icc-related predicted phosphoesterase